MMLPKLLSALKQENFVVVSISKSASSLYASSTENTYPKLISNLKYGRTEIPAMFLFFMGLSSLPNYLRFQSSLMRLLSETFRPRVVIYSKIDLSLSRPRWFGWKLMPISANMAAKPYPNNSKVKK